MISKGRSDSETALSNREISLYFTAYCLNFNIL